jgi:hypothetical protein
VAWAFEPVGQVFGAAVYATGYTSGYSCPGVRGSSGGMTPGRPATQVSGRGDAGSFGPLVQAMYQARRTALGRARGGGRPAVPGVVSPRRAGFHGQRHRGARRGERRLVGVGSVYLTTHSVLVTLIAAVSAGACLARAVARAFIRDCCLQPTVPRTAVSYAIASARQPTTTQSDRILLQLTEHVSGEYLTLPVSRRGPRGVQAEIAGTHAQGLAACLTLPSEEHCAIAEHGDYPEPRQPGTRQERMGW